MRAFILGNSGELLDHELSLLKGEVVFGVNALPLRCPEIMTHYVCMDIGMAYVPEVRALVSESCIKYYGRTLWNTIHHEESVKMFDTYPDGKIGFEISETKVYPCGTVVYPALQIAAALGYNPIYLLGVDIGLPENGISHIPEHQKMIDMITAKNLACPSIDKRFNNPSFKDLTKMLSLRFAFAASVLRENQIEVINLSNGGQLRSFKRENYEELLAKEKVNG